MPRIKVHEFDDVTRKFKESELNTDEILDFADKTSVHYGIEGGKTCLRVGLKNGKWMYIEAVAAQALRANHRG